MGYSSTGGDLTAITRPDNSRATYAYDSTYHKVITVKDSLNHVTSYGYNTSGDLITITNPLNQVTTIAWSNGLEQSVTDPLGHTASYVYDTGRHLIATVDALGDRTSYGYDGARHLITVQDALGHTTSYAYRSFAATKGEEGLALSLVEGEPLARAVLGGGNHRPKFPAPQT
jgi:YD repeat-containing protein